MKKSVTEHLLSGNLSVAELQRCYDLQHKIGVDVEALEYEGAADQIEGIVDQGPSLYDLVLKNCTKYADSLPRGTLDLSLCMLKDEDCPGRFKARRNKALEQRKKHCTCHTKNDREGVKQPVRGHKKDTAKQQNLFNT